MQKALKDHYHSVCDTKKSQKEFKREVADQLKTELSKRIGNKENHTLNRGQDPFANVLVN
jgi:hypothetical protein